VPAAVVVVVSGWRYESGFVVVVGVPTTQASRQSNNSASLVESIIRLGQLRPSAIFLISLDRIFSKFIITE